MDTIEIKGVLLRKNFQHLGNNLEVLVELPDGTYRTVISGYRCDEGPIEHYVHPAGIASAPAAD